jgi:predicted lipoprotein with Yx(FWY)xxD motif
MRRSILPLHVVPATAIGIAACGSSSSNNNDTAAASMSSGLVSVANVDGGKVLTDSAGKTLYSTSAEQGGEIYCMNGCTSFWKPLDASTQAAASAAKQLHQKLSTTMRPDGTRQLTLDGMPLYTFASEGARQLQGDGFTDNFQGEHFVWKAARTSGNAQASTTTPSSNGY